jgi:preprotein translocase subunit SecE
MAKDKKQPQLPAKQKTDARKPEAKKPEVKLTRRERGVVAIFNRMRKYFRDMYSELKKATWPTKKEIVKYTGVVIAFVVILAVVIGLMDLGLTQLLKLITG